MPSFYDNVSVLHRLDINVSQAVSATKYNLWCPYCLMHAYNYRCPVWLTVTCSFKTPCAMHASLMTSEFRIGGCAADNHPSL